MLDKLKDFFGLIPPFNWFRKTPAARLQKEYEAKLKEAKIAEKFGDRALQANLYAEAEAILKKIDSTKMDGGLS